MKYNEKLDKEIQWHPPYVAAMNLELSSGTNNVKLEPEHTLNTGTLKIDLLVECDGSRFTGNEIGELFKQYNIMEYKNPNDALDIDVFMKAQGYACLFKAYGEKADSRKIENITVSLVREAKPEKLFSDFGKYGTKIEIPYPGIYYITGNIVPFKTQVIVTKELDKTKHRWLCALSGKLEEQDLKELIASIHQLKGKMEKEYASSVLEVVLKANKKLTEKIRSNKNMSSVLSEIMGPIVEKMVEERMQEYMEQGMAQGIEQGMQQGIEQGMRQGIEQGMQQGEKKGMVYAYYEMNLNTNEIAKKVQLSEDEVLEIIRKKKGQQES